MEIIPELHKCVCSLVIVQRMENQQSGIALEAVPAQSHANVAALLPAHLRSSSSSSP